jgi:hypothetical protein
MLLKNIMILEEAWEVRNDYAAKSSLLSELGLYFL